MRNSEVALIITAIFFARATDNKFVLGFLAILCLFLYVLFLSEEVRYNKRLLKRMGK